MCVCLCVCMQNLTLMDQATISLQYYANDTHLIIYENYIWAASISDRHKHTCTHTDAYTQP